MRNFFIVFIGQFVFVLSFFIFLTPITRADTHITNETSFASGAMWTKEGSPYIIDDDILVPQSATLTIEPGVTITTSSSSPGSLFIRGTLIINGTSEFPVTINSIAGLIMSYSTSSISHAIITVPTGLDVTKSNLTISSTTISGAFKGIASKGSTLHIVDSIISDNNYGVYSALMPLPVFQAFNIFGFSIAHAQTSGDSPNENHIFISSSSIVRNSLYGIYNETQNTVNAKNNWWGSAAGPGSTTGSILYGNVDYTPWLIKDPTISEKVLPCCSNVLFLPGIESSRLYIDQKTFSGISTNQLWEPNRNADVEKLFMTPAGQSINSGIYTKDIIDSALGLFPIYKGFIAMMNSVVADKIINSWTAYPYDWRFDVATIVSQKLINAVQTLASSSKTGKVTIVAHSNGGLIAKLLSKTLSDKGESNLIDKIILVAVPQLGTPQAIAGLLHGDNEDILGGIITSQSTARQLAQNMPGGYGLLPSRAYFSNFSSLSGLGSSGSSESLLSPLVSFSSSTLAGFNFSADSPAIKSYDALSNFLSGLSDRRSAPSNDDINSPAILRLPMINSSQKIHDIIDNFSFASTAKAIVLAGWGKPTLSGISYYEKSSCSDSAFVTLFTGPSTCSKLLEHSPVMTLLGDDTVTLQSAATPISSTTNYYFDLGSESKGKIVSDGHSSILNTDSAVAFVKDEIADPESDLDGYISLPPYISKSVPTVADSAQNDLVVSVHSPVEINMYDSRGNHTGPIPNPDPTSDLGRFETNIPGSEYVPNEGDTYIRVPYGTNYRITFSGTGMGSFEVDTEHDVNGAETSHTTFADMPVTPLLKAELILSTTTPSSATSSPTMASTTQIMTLDFNGDGTVDATSPPHDVYDPILDLESYQAIISSFNLSPFREEIMRAKIALIIDYLKKKKTLKETKKLDLLEINAAKATIADLQNQHWIFKNLDSGRKQKLEDIFQAILDEVDIP